VSESEGPLLPGELDKDQIDALRIETSSMSPKEHVEFVRLVGICNDGLLSHYGKFISEKHPADELERKFLIMDQETYEGFHDEWYNPQIITRYTEEGEKGYMREYHGSEGGFVAGFLPQDQIWKVQSEDDKSRLVAQFGSEEEARATIKDLASMYITLHEVAHTYQNPELPLQFKEAGAYYYARAIMQKQQWGSFSVDNYDQPADFYSSLEDKYGDDIHKLFFGVLSEDPRTQKIIGRARKTIQKPLRSMGIIRIRKEKILSEFTPEITAKIFPGFHVAQSPSK
jgi:hypothetical protein